MNLNKIDKEKNKNNWFTYLLECGDGSLYCGSTNNLKNRINKHSSGKGAKYTRSHLPVKLVYFQELPDKSKAIKREVEIKKLSRKKKLELVARFSMTKNHPTRNKNIPASYLVLKQKNKVLLLRRFNTGYKDGQYSLVAGHVDKGESFTDALIREAKEESGLEILTTEIKTVHIMHRKSNTDGSERVDVFHLVENFKGNLKNMEPHKCDDLSWFDINQLPKNIIPYIKKALENIKKGKFYSEYGWRSNKRLKSPQTLPHITAKSEAICKTGSKNQLVGA